MSAEKKKKGKRIQLLVIAHCILTSTQSFGCKAWVHTVAEAGVVSEARGLGLEERWLALHLLPKRQNFPLIILQALLVHILQPKFLWQNIIKNQ